ncbi:MAG: UDP-2,3-diacylglucosamine diphosphatase [Planctomycetota bacterium]|nr:MAG: UDP-2,3-diacylglucosamine diphosphatase [Planctomycetota bacterium]
MNASRPPELPLGPPLTPVLGTPLFSVDLRADPELWLLSDLHLHPGDTASFEAFDAWLDAVPAGAPVLILGDLFEYWCSDKQSRDPRWRPLLDLLRRHVERGLRIWILHGNRDFLLGSKFERATGAVVVPGGLLVQRPGDMQLLCLHGDELCLNDQAYQKAKRRLRSWWMRLLSRLLPYALSKRIAGGLREHSGKAISAKEPLSMRPSQRAFRELLALPAQELIFGHIHRAGHGLWPEDPKARRYLILPAFEAEAAGHARQSSSQPIRYWSQGQEQPWPEDEELGA